MGLSINMMLGLYRYRRKLPAPSIVANLTNITLIDKDGEEREIIMNKEYISDLNKCSICGLRYEKYEPIKWKDDYYDSGDALICRKCLLDINYEE